MRRIILSCLVLAVFVLTGCHSRPKARHHLQTPADTLRYATLLDLETDGEATLCRILNPWNKEQELAAYLLLPRDTARLSLADAARYEELYADYTPLYVPLEHITLTSGCQAYLLDLLGALDHVAVMCDADYVCTPSVEQAIAEGRICSGGNAALPNMEVILAAGSDAAWISPFENAGSGAFAQLPIPVIFCADYMEVSPLARAEWMKFYGRLVGRTAEADSLFLRVEHQYLAQCDTLNVGTTGVAPKLLAETVTGATWYVPGGCSTAGELYADAGADYYWKDDTHSGSLSLSPEAVLQRAEQCDVWLIKYYRPEGQMSLREFSAQHPFYARFKAVGEGQVYGCNTATSIYFDETPFRPDLLLYSVRRTLHPELPDTLLLAHDTLVKKARVRMDTIVDPGYFQRLR